MRNRDPRPNIAALEARLAQVTQERDELDFLLHEGGPDSVANVIARAERAEAKLAEAASRIDNLETWLATAKTALMACSDIFDREGATTFVAKYQRALVRNLLAYVKEKVRPNAQP